MTNSAEKTIDITFSGNPYAVIGKVAFADLTITGNAEPTSRVLDGSLDHGFTEEWSEPATLPSGQACRVIYLFDDADIVDTDGEPLESENYPWDPEHIRRVVVD